jgi:hypothetical protein
MFLTTTMRKSMVRPIDSEPRREHSDDEDEGGGDRAGERGRTEEAGDRVVSLSGGGACLQETCNAVPDDDDGNRWSSR